jgi:DNA polymerase-1
MANRVFLIDGSSFCYRAVYAIRNLSSSDGKPTNAIYGAVQMLRKILREESPEYLAFCFDLAAPTFRHKRYKDYKAHRKPMPDELVEQMPAIKEVLHAYRIPIFEVEGYEADDLLGTLAKKLAGRGLEVFVVTGDKDALQLVNDKVRVYSTHTAGLIYDVSGVRDRFGGLGPERVVDIMALAGDSIDNIPGVPGIGEKTALELIAEFGSLDRLYKNLAKVKSESRRKALLENEKLAQLSRELAQIDCEVPVDFDVKDLAIQPPDEESLSGLFRRFEFRSLLKELVPTGEKHQEKREYHRVTSEKEFQAFCDELKRERQFALDTETTSIDPHMAHLIGLSFSFEEREATYIPVSSESHRGAGLPESTVIGRLRPILEERGIRILGQNIKYDLLVLKNHGVRLGGRLFDTMVASYLINPLKLNHNLDDISFEYLGVKKIATRDMIGSGRNEIRMDDVPIEKITEYACEDADGVFRLQGILEDRLKEDRLTKLFEEVEMPLVRVLAEMERNGVKIDTEFLRKLSRRCEQDLQELTGKIYEEAGEEFNINSTKQLSEVLFTRLKLPKLKKTKTGYSTDVKVLGRLAENYRLPRLLLEYRERAKLKSTYLDALPELVNPKTGMIHTSFNQTVTATGRLSSSEPNLQNIPIKTELGREIRKAFVPRGSKRKIMAADYSQIELRLLAHFSEDPVLVEAFRKDLDIHRFTASLLYGLPPEDVTREMRNVAKTINFSILYGKTAFGLSKDLQLSIPEAEAFIKAYFERTPKVERYLESQKELARRQRYLTTILGRRSYFPNLKSKNPMWIAAEERAAINAPLQGSAADLIKLAMIAIQEELGRQSLKSVMILQVHDELVFDAPEEELPELEELVREEMEGALELRVPLKVDIFVGDSWYKE